MQIALWIILGLIIAYILFIVGPALTGFLMTFRKIDWCVPLEENPEPKGYYEPYMDKMLEDIDFFKAMDCEEIQISASDNAILYGRFYDAGAKRTVIMAHGFMTTAMESFAVSGRVFFERGYNVLIIDERAHGKSGGKRTTMGLMESKDLLGWADWASNRVTCGEIYLYGVSMGAFAVALAAGMEKNQQIKALIIDSAFISIKSQLMKEYRMRKLPAHMLIVWTRIFGKIILGRDISFSAEESLRACDIPVFFIHGEADLTVDLFNQTLLYNSCASVKQMAVVPGANHTMGFVAGGTELQNKIFSFIEGEKR